MQKYLKVIWMIIFCTVFFAVRSQTDNNDYKKFRISANVGRDYALGSSNTVLSTPFLSEFTLPYASSGLGLGFSTAYFFSANYGIGLKYHFYTANGKFETLKPDERYTWIDQNLSFKEQSHFFIPAVYGRWSLFNSKWEILSNIGIAYLYNNLSEIKSESRVLVPEQIQFTEMLSYSSFYSENITFDDIGDSAFGLAVSASICYRITPVIGIGLCADGFFASLNNDFVQRRINRIGISAEVNFNL